MELFEYLNSKGVRVVARRSHELEIELHKHSNKLRFNIAVELVNDYKQSFAIMEHVDHAFCAEKVFRTGRCEWSYSYAVTKETLDTNEMWKSAMTSIAERLMREEVVALHNPLNREEIDLECVTSYTLPLMPVGFA